MGSIMELVQVMATVQQRGNMLLACFPHDQNYRPIFRIDYRTGQSTLVVKAGERVIERKVSSQLVCNAPKKQASDALELVYRDIVKELSK
jgi:hypothetical protein